MRDATQQARVEQLAAQLIRQANAVVFAAYVLIDEDMTVDQISFAMARGTKAMDATISAIRREIK